jgi:hypothetical protein
LQPQQGIEGATGTGQATGPGNQRHQHTSGPNSMAGLLGPGQQQQQQHYLTPTFMARVQAFCPGAPCEPDVAPLSSACNCSTSPGCSGCTSALNNHVNTIGSVAAWAHQSHYLAVSSGSQCSCLVNADHPWPVSHQQGGLAGGHSPVLTNKIMVAQPAPRAVH